MEDSIILNMDEGYIISDGEKLPVVAWALDGEDCEPDVANGCVAGPDSKGNWRVIDLSDFRSLSVS